MNETKREIEQIKNKRKKSDRNVTLEDENFD